MTVPWEILVVSSDFERRHDLATILNREGIDPICTSTISDCREIVAKRNVGLVFCDGHLRQAWREERSRFGQTHCFHGAA